MTDTMMETAPGQALARKIATDDLATVLLARADAEGVSLVDPGGLLGGLTKSVLEAGLEAELDEHLGYGPYDPAGHNSGNSRNGTRSKTGNLPVWRTGIYDALLYCFSHSMGGIPARVVCILAVLYQLIHRKIARRASARVANTWPWMHSRLSDAQKLSATALS